MKLYNYFLNRRLLLYVLKFLLIFCICYFGTLAIIGLSAPGNFYSKIIARYFDYIKYLRIALLHFTKSILISLGYPAYLSNDQLLKVKNGSGVRIVYSCIGYGIMSFWIAFIVANNGNALKKVKWVFGGLFLIFIINVSRLCLLVIATNKRWIIPFFNHHTWFNIFAYFFIGLLIYFYDKSTSKLSD